MCPLTLTLTLTPTLTLTLTLTLTSQAIDGPPQVPAAQYLAGLARAYARGWRVDFGADAAVG